MKAAELAESLGLPARQIRYMITEGIIPRATGVGRYADGFGEEHLAAGRRYLELRAEGHSAYEVKRLMAAERQVTLYQGPALALTVDPNVDPETIDVEAVLADLAAALAQYVNQDKE